MSIQKLSESLKEIAEVLPFSDPALGPDVSNLSRYRVDGITPKLLVLPQNVDQVSRILSLASEEKVSVIPSGNGSKLDFGNPPKGADLILSLCKLNRIIEYEPADLTATVEAGMPFSDFQSVLSKEGQFLALDPPYESTATIGGIVATNSNGPLRLRYGTSRDMVIGVKVVLADGSIAKSGGKVVKNVAGYDLNKLFIGSFGTLGVIVELSFKLQPLPHHKSSVLVSFKTLSQAASFAFKVLDSPLLPSFLELISFDPESSPSEVRALQTNSDDLMALIIGLDGHVEASNWQRGEVEKFFETSDASSLKVLNADQDLKVRGFMRRFAERHLTGKSESDVICKASVLISEVESFMESARLAAESIAVNCDLLSHIGSGIILIRFSPKSAEGQSLDQISIEVLKLREKCVQRGGNLIIESAPPHLKSKLEVWGEPKSDFRLIQAIKSELDPNSILNPNRFVGGV